MSTNRLLLLCCLNLLASTQARANGITAYRTIAGRIADEVSTALIDRSSRRSAILRLDTTTALKRPATATPPKACEIKVGATVVVVDSGELYSADESKAQSLGLEVWERSRLLLDGTVGKVVAKDGDIVGFREDATGYEYVIGVFGLACPACLHVGARYVDSRGKDITVEETLFSQGGFSVTFSYGGVNKTGMLHGNIFKVPWWQTGTVEDDGNLIFDDGSSWIKKEPSSDISPVFSSRHAKLIGIIVLVVIMLALFRESTEYFLNRCGLIDFFAGCCNCCEGNIQSTQRKLNIQIRNLQGDIFELQLLGSQYVEGVKDMIHKKDGEEIEKFFIETDQWYLKENYGITMNHAGLQDGDTIYMRKKGQGHSKPPLELSESQRSVMTSRQKRLKEAAKQ